MTFSWELNDIFFLADLERNYYRDIFAKRTKIPCSFVFLKDPPIFMSENHPVRMPKLSGGGYKWPN